MSKTTLAPQPAEAPSAKTQTEIQPQGCASDDFVKAIKDGDLAAAKALYAHDPSQAACTKEIVQLAAMSGQVELLEWTHSLTEDDCSKAFLHRLMEKMCFKQGHLQVFQWLHDHAYRFCTPAMFRGAADSGSMDTVLWICEHHPEVYELAKAIRMDNVACHDNLSMIKWLHERDFFFGTTSMDAAAHNGHLEIVRWLHENRTEGSSTWALDSAATFGHLDVVMFLHFHRSEGGTTVAMDLAAENGHIEVLQFLHYNRNEGCTTNAMDNAPNVGILSFLHENRSEGCTDEIVSNAVAKGSVPILEWLLVNKRELVDLENVREIAVHKSKHEVIAWVELVVAEAVKQEEEAILAAIVAAAKDVEIAVEKLTLGADATTEEEVEHLELEGYVVVTAKDLESGEEAEH